MVTDESTQKEIDRLRIEVAEIKFQIYNLEKHKAKLIERYEEIMAVEKKRNNTH